MLRGATLILLFTVSVHCEFNCSTCNCDYLRKSVNCINTNYASSTLQGKDIKFDSTITNLRIQEVQLKIIPGSVFKQANLEKIMDLAIYACGVEVIETEALKHLFELKVFRAGRNRIKNLPVGMFEDNRKLEEIYFEENQIEALQNGLFSNLTSLTKVEFYRNNIANIESNVFRENENLKWILLSDNSLKTFDGSMLDDLTKLEKLTGYSNPWTCDCHLSKFLKVMSRLRSEIKLTCKDAVNIEILRMKHWRDIETRELKCLPRIKKFIVRYSNDPNSNKVTLSCQIISNPGPKSVLIYKNLEHNGSTTNRGDTKDQFVHNYEITLNDINDEINNTYTCTSENLLGTADNVTIDIKDYYQGFKQNIVELNNKKPSYEFDCTEFETWVTAVTWYFNNTPIRAKNNKKYEILTTNSGQNGVFSKLIVKDFRTTDYGIYKCTDSDGNREQVFEYFLFDPHLERYTNWNTILSIITYVGFALMCVFICFVIWYRKYNRNQQIKENIASMMMEPRPYNEIYCNTEDVMNESAV